MNNTNDFPANDLITRCLSGQATEDELKKLELWVNESSENLKYYHNLKNIWEGSMQLTVSSEAALKKVMKQINHRKSKPSIGHFLQKIAAILFIPLLLGTLWLTLSKNYRSDSENQKFIEVAAAFGTFSSLELPDGSKVWLNSGSKIKYPERFTNDNRTVQLVGEAYFEVKSDESSPFFVNTPSFTVKATGTRFNVMAFDNCQQPSVALAEGKVTVLDKNAKSQGITYLQPDQLLKFDISKGSTEVINEDVYKHFAWKDGKLVFRNDLLSEVAKRISIQYNVDIEIVGDQVKQYRYRATFENESLDELLKLLKLSSPFDYREISSQLLPDGTYTRKKIIIYSTSQTNN